MKLSQPKKSNCFIWMVWQLMRYGGRPRMVGSLYGWWPHFMWQYDGVTYEYSPPKHNNDLEFPPLWFEGRVQIFKQIKSERIIIVDDEELAIEIFRN